MLRDAPALRVSAVLLTVLLSGWGLTGCSGQGAAEQPDPGSSPSGASSTQPPENTASPDPQSSDPPEPATTPVPPPSPGTVNETVESRSQESRDPVGLDQTGSFDDEVTAEITSVRTIAEPEAGMPDEVVGPALAVTLEITNGSVAALSADAVVLEVLDATGAPGNRLTGEPYDPIEGEVGAGQSVSGTYVYTVPEDQRDPVSVIVTLSADDPLVVFEGPVR